MGKKSCITRYFRVKSRDCLNLICLATLSVIFFASDYTSYSYQHFLKHYIQNLLIVWVILCAKIVFFFPLSNNPTTNNQQQCLQCLCFTYLPCILTNFLPSRAFVAFIFLKRSRGLPDPKWGRLLPTRSDHRPNDLEVKQCGSPSPESLH